MLINYFKIALRNLIRQPVFSLINILGLSIGISVTFVIYLIVHYSLSFDKFHKDADRIYRVIADYNYGDLFDLSPGMPVPFASAIKKEVTGIDEVVQLEKYRPEILSIPSATGLKPALYKKEKQIVFVDDSYFRLIDYKWIAGSPEALDKPYQVVLTEKRAHEYFPNEDMSQVIGKSMTFDSTFTASVGGIVKDLDENTDFDFTAFISLSTIPDNYKLRTSLNWDKWGNAGGESQIMLKLFPQSSRKSIADKLNHLVEKRRQEGELVQGSFSLQPLADIHFNTSIQGLGSQRSISRSTLYSLMVIALFLLLLGAFNFINLTTAQSAQRAKEIGIRKTMGGSRRQLIEQFFAETFLVTILAGVISIALLPFFFRLFSVYFPVPLHTGMIIRPYFFIFFIVLITFITFAAGWYPALLLSRFRPVAVLRNMILPSGYSHKLSLRKVLITGQFVIAQVFVTSTLFMVKQTHFLLSKDLGFNKEAIVYFSIPHEYRNDEANKRYQQQASGLLKSIREMPEIARVSLSSSPPSSGALTMTNLTVKQQQEEVKIPVVYMAADSDYLKIYGFKLLAGSANLRPVEDFLINETLQKRLGYKSPSDAVGKLLDDGTIAGVIADFNDMPLNYKIEPLRISTQPSPGNTFSILLKPQSPGNHTWERAIARLKKEWSLTYPGQDFHLRFLDETIASFYGKEQQLLKLLYWLTAISMLISSLGLLGLVIHVTSQRTKEIGIRKILGASLQHLAYILCREFVLLVLLAATVAAPITWILADKYLQRYAYRTELSWWVFILGVTMMLLVTLVTLGYRTIKTAKTNPARNLRTE